MSTELTTESTKLTTAEINTVTAEIIILKQQTAINIIEIGKRLIAVKESLAHGKWGKWLSEKVDFTDRTAQRFMKAATEFSNPTALSDLPQTKIFALLDLPAEEREEFINSNPIDEMTTRELQQAITEKNEALKLLERAQKVAADKAEEANKAKADLQMTKSELMTSDKCLRDVQGHVKDLQDALQKKRDESKEEFERLHALIASTKKQLTEAQSSGDNEEAIRLQESLEKTDNELVTAIEKIAELEKQLKEKPIETSISTSEVITVEVIPEDTKQELNELREKVKDSQGNELTLKFSFLFETLVKGFSEILNLLEAVSNADKEAGEKRKKALSVTLSKMLERL